MPATRLVLVRHGERADMVPLHEWRVQRRSSPRPRDPPLTTRGREQAAQVADEVRRAAPEAKLIYSSPLRRCLETTAEIAHKLGLPVKVVVPLAKPCKYFRQCELEEEAPKFADKEEAAQILREVHPDVQLIGFEDEDRSHAEALEAISAAAVEEQPKGERPQFIVVGHCEAQKELAHAAGIPERIKTPYCGTAVFERDQRNDGVAWKLISRPVVVSERASHPTDSRERIFVT